MKAGAARKLATLAIATLVPTGLGATANIAHAVQNNGGSASETTCEVVSVGNWYCTIDGKGYYCTTPKNPDKNKDCMPAKRVRNPGPVLNPAGGAKKLN